MVPTDSAWIARIPQSEAATTEAVELGGMTPNEKDFLDKAQRMPTYPKDFKNDNADLRIVPHRSGQLLRLRFSSALVCATSAAYAAQ